MDNIFDQLQTKIANYWDIIILKIPEIALSILIFGAFYFMARLVGRIFFRRMKDKTDDNITVRFVVRLVRVVMIVMGIVLALHTLGFEDIAGGLLAGAGVGAIVLGFAFKEIGENFLAGFILVFDRPFDIGDTVTINGNVGKVVQLKFRITHVKTFEGKDLYIPNAIIINTEVFNHTRDGFYRQDFLIGIDYDDDIEKARSLLTEVIDQHPEVLKEPASQVLVNEFGASTVNLKVLFWVDTLDYRMGALETKTQVMRISKETLVNNGFSLPANIQEIKMYDKDPITLSIKKEE